MSKLHKAGIQPCGDIRVENPAEIAAKCDLKNDYPVVFVDRADVAENLDYLSGGPWCLNDPERKERAAPVGGGLQR